MRKIILIVLVLLTTSSCVLLFNDLADYEDFKDTLKNGKKHEKTKKLIPSERKALEERVKQRELKQRKEAKEILEKTKNMTREERSEYIQKQSLQKYYDECRRGIRKC